MYHIHCHVAASQLRTELLKKAGAMTSLYTSKPHTTYIATNPTQFAAEVHQVMDSRAALSSFSSYFRMVLTSEKLHKFD